MVRSPAQYELQVSGDGMFTYRVRVPLVGVG